MQLGQAGPGGWRGRQDEEKDVASQGPESLRAGREGGDDGDDCDGDGDENPHAAYSRAARPSA